jgi:hypothetical protein
MFITFFPSGAAGPPGPPGQDRFAPKYLVGSPTDTAAALAGVGGFWFFPDTGDGAGIAAALAQPNGIGDVWIRPGTFDLGSGAVLTPLAVPANCIVRGAGIGVTTIIGRAVGDQGVFVLSPYASLRDMSISSPAPTGATAGSTAVVRCLGVATTEDLAITIAPETGSTITDALLFEAPVAGPFPASILTNTTLAMLGTGTALSRGLHLQNTQTEGASVLATNLQIFGAPAGFTTGIRVDNSALIATQLLMVGFTDFGVEHIGPDGVVRIDQASILTGGAAGVGVVGVSIQGNSSILRSVAVQNDGASVGIGIRLIAPGATDPVTVTIDDCAIGGFNDGVVGGSLGGPGVESDLVGCVISHSRINASRRGIWLSGPVCATNHLLGNTVFVQQGLSGPPPLAGILIEKDPLATEGTFGNLIKGNTVAVTLPAQTSTVHGIDSASQRSIVEGNAVSLTLGGYCVYLREGADRNTVTGNICQASGDSLGCIYFAPTSLVAPFPSTARSVCNGNSCDATYTVNPAPGTNTAIVCESEQTTVNNNSVAVSSPGSATPGVLLTASSTQNTAIGNICEGSGGTAVDDLGTFNEVAHNVGA